MRHAALYRHLHATPRAMIAKPGECVAQPAERLGARKRLCLPAREAVDEGDAEFRRQIDRGHGVGQVLLASPVIVGDQVNVGPKRRRRFVDVAQIGPRLLAVVGIQTRRQMRRRRLLEAVAVDVEAFVAGQPRHLGDRRQRLVVEMAGTICDARHPCRPQL